jgi:hypothetical protein
MSEVPFPQTGREGLDRKGRMGIDALEYSDAVVVRSAPLPPALGEHTLNDADVMRAHFRPAEQVVFSVVVSK